MTSANLVYANASSRCTHFEGSKFFHPSRKESNRGIILRVPTALVAGPQGEDNQIPQEICMHSERDVKRRPLWTLVYTKRSTPENNSLNWWAAQHWLSETICKYFSEPLVSERWMRTRIHPWFWRRLDHLSTSYPNNYLMQRRLKN